MQNEQLTQYIATVLQKAEATAPVYVEQLLNTKYVETIIAIVICAIALVVVATGMFYCIKKSKLDLNEKRAIAVIGSLCCTLIVLLCSWGVFDLWKIKTAPSVVVIEHITGK